MKKLIIKILLKFVERTIDLYWNDKYNKFRTKYILPKSFHFNGKHIQFYGDGKIEIGEKSYIGGFSTIQVSSFARVAIGNYCSISHNVRMYTSTSITDQDFTITPQEPSIKGDIIIGNGVWIGANVFIGPNIKIGDNTIVGANSVVTKNIEPFSIVGGVPAKLIRYKNIY